MWLGCQKLSLCNWPPFAHRTPPQWSTRIITWKNHIQSANKARIITAWYVLLRPRRLYLCHVWWKGMRHNLHTFEDGRGDMPCDQRKQHRYKSFLFLTSNHHYNQVCHYYTGYLLDILLNISGGGFSYGVPSFKPPGNPFAFLKPPVIPTTGMS